MRLTRKIFASPALGKFVVDERIPGSDLEDDETLNRYIRESSGLMYHPCGSCKMGDDAMAVVNDKLQVRGIDGLWVADASIFPTIPAGNINATCIMVGDKAANLIEKSETQA